jgi:hypothetical protein
MNAETETEPRALSLRGITIPYAIGGPLVALMIATGTWCFGQSMRLTAAETEIRHLATSDQVAQLRSDQAAQTQKLDDFQREYERDRINDRVVAAREGTPR